MGTSRAKAAVDDTGIWNFELAVSAGCRMPPERALSVRLLYHGEMTFMTIYIRQGDVIWLGHCSASGTEQTNRMLPSFKTFRSPV